MRAVPCRATVPTRNGPHASIVGAPTLRLCSLLGLGLAIGVSAASAQQMEDVEIETVSVVDGVYMLVGQGGNIGVSVGDDGIILIDDQYAPLTDKIIAAVRALTDRPILFVLNTHWHGDHTGGNENLGSAGAIIVAHENVRRRMSTEQFQEMFDSTTPPAPDAALPVVTFTDSVTFHLNDERIEVLHVDPAHTDGDSVVFFRHANAVHLGDLYFAGRFPFIDVSSGGSVDGMIRGVERVLGEIDAATRIIPGHGRLSKPAGLREYLDMLRTVRDRVRREINAGKSLEEVKATAPTRGYGDSWGQGFISAEVFVEILYSSLSN